MHVRLRTHQTTTAVELRQRINQLLPDLHPFGLKPDGNLVRQEATIDADREGFAHTLPFRAVVPPLLRITSSVQ